MNYLKSNHAQDIFFRYKNRNKLDGELKDLLNWFISEKINSSNYIRIKQIIQIFES
jgi:predicted transcriptional regulator